jgi:hypothetical protein
MASLRNLFLSPRARLYFRPDADEEYMNHIHQITLEVGSHLKSRETILVNAQKVYADMNEMPDEEALPLIESKFALVPCPKPPYFSMWLECIQYSTRVGVLVLRAELDDSGRQQLRTDMEIARPDAREYLFSRIDQAASTAVGHAFLELNTDLIYMGRFEWWMDERGSCVCSFLVPSRVTAYPYADQSLQTQLAWTILTMARLNCHNVELRPTAGSASRKHKKRQPQAPFSIWHEIVVKEGPVIRAVREAQRENPAEAEKHAVRLHKVRGHFADYRQGAGRFGKYKVLVWVEKHKSGQAEQGTVVASLRVG